MPKKINIFWTLSTILAIVFIIFFIHYFSKLQTSPLEESADLKEPVTNSEKNNLNNNKNEKNDNSEPQTGLVKDIFSDLESESSSLDDFSKEIDKQ
ncbi:MAG: hypothetical protein PHZ25_00165 [Candidatus Pacebacteria bacterium]|nr:hypothetical protein [Candidatus Paceibacterota bacterium]